MIQSTNLQFDNDQIFREIYTDVTDLNEIKTNINQFKWLTLVILIYADSDILFNTYVTKNQDKLGFSEFYSLIN